MADWTDLYSKAQVAVQDASGYLRYRVSITNSLPEMERLQELEQMIQASAAELQPITGEVGGQDQTIQIYFDHLDLTHTHILDLHETDPVSTVEVVIENLNSHVMAMASPHGPGRGRPGAGGPGKGRPGSP